MNSDIEKEIKKILLEIHDVNVSINNSLKNRGEKNRKVSTCNEKQISKPAINLRELNQDLLENEITL